MSTQNNILTQPNQYIVFKMNTPVTSISSIDGYTDETVGEDASVYFERYFRYSIDTINFSNWIQLTDTSLQQIQFEPHYDVVIEFKYIRVGDSGGQLQWNWTNLECSKVQKQCGSVFDQSIFSTFYDCCCNDDVLIWCSNVLNKLYDKGILMQAMTRNQNQNQNQEDRDFIDFWRSVSCYFAMIVSYARIFENIDQRKELLRSYLNARHLYVKNTQGLSDMRMLMKNRFKIIRKRGTLSMTSTLRFVEQSSYINTLFDQDIDGEFLRMISFNPIKDEFLFSVTHENNIGLSINQHSPLYKGIQQQSMLVKLYNIPNNWTNAEDIYPIINPSKCTALGSLDDVVLSIATPEQGQVAGIGIGEGIFGGAALFEPGLFEPGLFQGDIGDQIDFFNKFTTIVDNSIGYQLCFYAKVSDLSVKLSVVIHGFDLNNQPIQPSSLDILSSGDQNVALSKVTLPKTDQWYFVRVNIYKSTQAYQNNQQLLKPSLLEGNHLKMSDFISKLSPEIVLDNTGADVLDKQTLELKQVQLLPLMTEYGKGLVQGQSLIETWIKNNSLQFDQSEIKSNIRNNMIPYRMAIKNNFL